MVSTWDGVHSGLGPFGIGSVRDWVHSGLCPFGMVSIQDCVHSRLYPFGIVSIRDRVHSGLCPFRMVSIRDGVHSGWCPFGIVSFGIVSIRAIVRILSICGQFRRILYTISKNAIPNGHHPECTPFRMDTIPNGNNRE